MQHQPGPGLPDADVAAREQYAAMQLAFSHASLELLQYLHAPFLCSVLELAFPHRGTLAVETFHGHVATLIRAQSDVGQPVRNLRDVAYLPSDAKEITDDWIERGWLNTDTVDGVAVCYPSASALDALRAIGELSKPRTLNTSRVQHLLAMVEEAALVASGDSAARIAQLERVLAESQDELERLKAGGAVRVATVQEMRDRYHEIAREKATLPADFRRVRELIEAEHRKLRERALADEESAGVILRDAMEAEHRVLHDTDEGRAFGGVRDLLRDHPDHLLTLRRHATDMLQHDFAAQLTAKERRDLGDIEGVFTSNITSVNQAAADLTATFQAIAKAHSSAFRGREVIEAIRRARAALLAFPDKSLPLSYDALDRIDADFLLTRPYDPSASVALRGITSYEPSEATPQSAEELARWAGPHAARLSEVIDAALADGHAVTLADVWEQAGEELHRSVEIIGLLALATTRGATVLRPSMEHDIITTISPDGLSRQWRVPRIIFQPVEVEP